MTEDGEGTKSRKELLLLLGENQTGRSVSVSGDRLKAASLPDTFVQVDTVFIAVSNIRRRCQLRRVGRMSKCVIFLRTTSACSAIVRGEVVAISIFNKL